MCEEAHGEESVPTLQLSVQGHHTRCPRHTRRFQTVPGHALMQGAPTIAAAAQQQTCARRGGCLRGCFAACVGVRPPQEIGLTAHVVQASDSIPDHGLDAMDTAWSGGRTCTETKHTSVLDAGWGSSALSNRVHVWQHGHHDRTRHTTQARSARVMLGTIPAALLLMATVAQRVLDVLAATMPRCSGVAPQPHPQSVTRLTDAMQPTIKVTRRVGALNVCSPASTRPLTDGDVGHVDPPQRLRGCRPWHAHARYVPQRRRPPRWSRPEHGGRRSRREQPPVGGLPLPLPPSPPSLPPHTPRLPPPSPSSPHTCSTGTPPHN